MAEPCVAKRSIGEHDLWLEGSIKVTGHAGVAVDIPVNTTLSGALAPTFLPLAQQQFETVVEQLLLTPAKVAFIDHLESVKAARVALSRKGSSI